MSNGWHWYIAILSLINIFACVWLIIWSGRQGDVEKDNKETTGHSWDGLEELNNPLPRWWLFLFIGTIIWGLGYLVYYPGLGAFPGTSGWTQKGQYEQERARVDAIYHEKFSRLAAMDYVDLANDTEAMDIAGRLFDGNCSTCHGSDAGGAPGFPNLTDNSWLYGSAPETIEQTIINGRSGIMPGWEAAVGVDGVMQLVEYTKSLSRMAYNHQPAEAGAALYKTMCVACHGIDGKGVQALGGANLTDDAWLYGKSDEEIIHSIAIGRNGQMPAHRDLLSSEEIKLLTAYVTTLSKE